jgi:hypothetical protein
MAARVGIQRKRLLIVYATAKESYLLNSDFPQVNQLPKSKNIMAVLTATQKYELSYLITRSQTLSQILGDLVRSSGNEHHALLVEILEEHLLKADKILNTPDPTA